LKESRRVETIILFQTISNTQQQHGTSTISPSHPHHPP